MQYSANLFKGKIILNYLTAAEVMMPPVHQLLLNATCDCKRQHGCKSAKIQGVVLRVQESFHTATEADRARC